MGVGVFADYDNDGYKDAFVSRTFKPNQIFHNNGDGTFTDVTASVRDRRRLLHHRGLLGRLSTTTAASTSTSAATSIRA